MGSDIRIGISGWTYPDWRGVFYPEAMVIKNELKYASQTFNAIEVNGTFYGLQKPPTFQRWYEETPAGFSFALKAPKYVTHERRLKDVKTPIANFFASGILALKEKLGPILWQLPPNLPLKDDRVEVFLKLLPHNTKDAGKMAEGHSDWLKGRTLLECDESRPLLHALEVRNHSFVSPDFIKLMRDHNVAIVVGDTAGRWPLIEEITSPLVYIRLHGDETIYPDGYTSKALKLWAGKIRDWSNAVNHVYAFCDNDHKIAAPLNAKKLKGLLAVDWSPPSLIQEKTKTKSKASKPKPSKATANNRTVGKPAGKSRAKNQPLHKRRKSSR